MNWLTELIKSDDAIVCSVTMCALLLVLALIGFSVVLLWMSPTTFSLPGYGSAAAAIMGTFGTIRIFRDRGRHDGDCDAPKP